MLTEHCRVRSVTFPARKLDVSSIANLPCTTAQARLQNPGSDEREFRNAPNSDVPVWLVGKSDLLPAHKEECRERTIEGQTRGAAELL